MLVEIYLARGELHGSSISVFDGYAKPSAKHPAEPWGIIFSDYVRDNPHLRSSSSQDSLGGTAYTVVCCNVSPIEASESETLSTLRFAERLKKVTTDFRSGVLPGSRGPASFVMNFYLVWFSRYNAGA